MKFSQTINQCLEELEGMDMTNECKGCMYCDINGVCGMRIIPYLSKTKQCPCMNCIVKIMCKGICEEFIIYDNYQKKVKTVINDY